MITATTYLGDEVGGEDLDADGVLAGDDLRVGLDLVVLDVGGLDLEGGQGWGWDSP